MSEIFKGPRNDRNYWRSLEELADTDEFRSQLENEFPGGIDAPVSGMTRRRFLQVMSASIALTSLAGCRWPVEKILPFAERPEGMTPGTPLQFATTMEIGPVAMGVMATSYDGRPVKIDGNPGLGLSDGAASAFAQASVLDLYDQDRSRAVLADGNASDWESFSSFASSHFRGSLNGVAILTEITTSPSHWDKIGKAAQKGASVYYYEPVCRINEIMGAAKAFGTGAQTQLDLSKANVIVDFDANMLQDHPTALRNNRQFAAGRQPESGHMNRLYVYENSYTTTGGMADHRFPTAARDIGPAVWALAAELVLGEGLALPATSGVSRGELNKWRGHAAGSEHVKAVAADLMANRGHGLLLAGMRQDADVHHLVHVLNMALGNSGAAISYVTMAMPQIGDLKNLTDDLNKGRIKSLIILGGQQIFATGFGNLQSSTHVHGIPGTQLVYIKTGTIGDATGVIPTVTQIQGYRILRLARHYVNRHFQGIAGKLQRNQVSLGNTQFCSRARTNQRSVIPRQLGHEIRHFLQPGIVGKTAIKYRLVQGKIDFQISCGQWL